MENKYTMEVSKKENGAYVPVGNVEVSYPLLSELGIDVAPSGKDDKGFPTYADERVQYVFDSVLAAVKAAARNKLQSGTVTLKDGLKIAETVEELLAGGERNGEALAAWRDYLASFKSWLPSKGKSAAWVAGVFDCVKNVAGIPYQPESRKSNILSLVAEHAASLSPDQMARFARSATKISEAAQSSNPLEGEDSF